MLVIRDPSQTPAIADRALKALADQRFVALSEDEPFDPDVLGYFIVVEDGDREEALGQHLGFSALTNRYDGAVFEEPGFNPSFELIEEHPSCFEMVFVLSDDGFGIVVFVPKGAAVDPRLTAMCRKYAIPAQERIDP